VLFRSPVLMLNGVEAAGVGAGMSIGVIA